MTVDAPKVRSAEPVLWHGGRLITDGAVTSSSMVVADGVIVWVGEASRAPSTRLAVDVRGALITPAFVDGHMHATDTGLALAGLDLSGSRSKADVLEAVSRMCRQLRGRTILGHGWDESAWPIRELPTAAELDRASYGSFVYLSRIDVHSALVSGALMSSVRSPAGQAGYDSSGWLSREAHQAIRNAALESITPGQRVDAQRLALQTVASLGIGAVHEMGGPDIGGADDAAALVALANSAQWPDVVVYWGQLAADGGIEAMRDIGGYGAGGDLFIDGAIGSRTACLRSPYSDFADTHGALYFDSAAVQDHVAQCTLAGIQAGFHVIGDAAMDTIISGMRAAASDVGHDALRTQHHRLEHAEMLDTQQISALADLGVIASVQPAFDASWGGDDGMYCDRLGPDRGVRLNPFADMLAAGIPLVFGSDSPVTAVDPWGAVRAAVQHRTIGQRVGIAAAFSAHTLAGHQSVGSSAGALLAGSAATFAVWAADFPRDAHGWPDLSATTTSPDCLRTVVRGTTVHDNGVLEEVAA